MLYTEFTADNITYKLRLRTRDIIALEKAVGVSPLGIFGKDFDVIPTITTMIHILHASMQAFNHNITLNDCYDIYDKWLEEGHDVIVEIEVQGAQKVMAKNPDVASIFIMPPSVEVLKNRLCGRSTDEAAQIEARLQTAIYEMAFAEKYDYVVFNDNLEDAVQQLVDIFKADRSKSSRNIEQIKEVCKYA